MCSSSSIEAIWEATGQARLSDLIQRSYRLQRELLAWGAQELRHAGARFRRRLSAQLLAFRLFRLLSRERRAEPHDAADGDEPQSVERRPGPFHENLPGPGVRSDAVGERRQDGPRVLEVLQLVVRRIGDRHDENDAFAFNGVATLGVRRRRNRIDGPERTGRRRSRWERSR